MKPPVRMLADRALPPNLAADLKHFTRATQGYDHAAGQAALQAALRDAASPPMAAKKWVRVATTQSVRVAGLAVGTAAFLIAGWLAVRGDPRHEARPRVVERVQTTHAPPASPAPAPAIETNSASQAAEPTHAAAAPTVAKAAIPRASRQPDTRRPGRERSQRGSSESSSHSPAAVGDGQQQLEIAQLAQIRQLLPRDPKAAYRLAEQGHREFGAGGLYHEREALAILALDAVGDHELAGTRARLFLSRFPRSPLRARIEATLSAPRVRP